MAIITLIAKDDLGRQRAQATFRRTWRLNPVRDRRERIYQVLTVDGCDFGSCTQFPRLPIGRQGIGFQAPYRWELAET